MNAPEDPALVAERLRLARRYAGMTQEDAARELGVTVRTYARWEKGVTLGFLKETERIAEVFGTTPEAILGIAGESQLEAKVDALSAELRELKALLLDPERLRRAAAALTEEEEVDPDA